MSIDQSTRRRAIQTDRDAEVENHTLFYGLIEFRCSDDPSPSSSTFLIVFIVVVLWKATAHCAVITFRQNWIFGQESTSTHPSSLRGEFRLLNCFDCPHVPHVWQWCGAVSPFQLGAFRAWMGDIIEGIQLIQAASWPDLDRRENAERVRSGVKWFAVVGIKIFDWGWLLDGLNMTSGIRPHSDWMGPHSCAIYANILISANNIFKYRWHFAPYKHFTYYGIWKELDIWTVATNWADFL